MSAGYADSGAEMSRLWEACTRAALKRQRLWQEQLRAWRIQANPRTVENPSLCPTERSEATGMEAGFNTVAQRAVYGSCLHNPHLGSASIIAPSFRHNCQKARRFQRGACMNAPQAQPSRAASVRHQRLKPNGALPPVGRPAASCKSPPVGRGLAFGSAGLRPLGYANSPRIFNQFGNPWLRRCG